MKSLPGGPVGFLFVSAGAFIILGSVLEGIPAIVLFGPLLFPIARQVGVHEVHYAMVVILAMGIGLFAPPFGVGYYAACAISRIHPDAGMRPIVGYILALLVGLVVIILVLVLDRVPLKIPDPKGPRPFVGAGQSPAAQPRPLHQGSAPIPAKGLSPLETPTHA